MQKHILKGPELTGMIELKRQLIHNDCLWQYNLLNCDKFARYASERDISVMLGNDIKSLWKTGLLRADVVRCTRKTDYPGLCFIKEKNGYFYYNDERTEAHIPQKLGGAYSKDNSDIHDFTLDFHPFRAFTLRRIVGIFEPSVSFYQYLMFPEGLERLAREEIDRLDSWKAKTDFREIILKANQISEFTIVLEPFAYSQVFNAIKYPFLISEDEYLSMYEAGKNLTNSFMRRIGKERVVDFRGMLAREAEFLDGNKRLHTAIRMMDAKVRHDLKSSIGLSILFLTMSEIIRHVYEDAMDDKLPEEDDIGFGQWFSDARERLYGTERVTDATQKQKRHFLSSFGLDYGIRVRCYVEGETEYSALTSAFIDSGGIDFINLKGQFVESKAKGLSFLASLKNDIEKEVFSFVFLDGDRQDNVRAIRKAAKDEKMFGRFYISSPDFEFYNFTVDELINILQKCADKNHCALPPPTELREKVADCKSGKEFFRAIDDLSLYQLSKGASWGKALIDYAFEHPEFPDNHERAGEPRTIIEAIRLISRATRLTYAHSFKRFRIDPDTGDFLKIEDETR